MKSVISSRSRRVGFTFVELITVTAVITILIALLVPAILQARETTRRTEFGYYHWQVDVATQVYRSNHCVLPLRANWSAGDLTSIEHLAVVCQTSGLQEPTTRATRNGYQFRSGRWWHFSVRPMRLPPNPGSVGSVETPHDDRSLNLTASSSCFDEITLCNGAVRMVNAVHKPSSELQ
ncbi:type II secretion system protein [Thalassoroseus pseudoceratinae]|uniref:type II secretion system protein n=1 Tax=Thalassoroseus pseudoceratinae TaxID=2713176 RepID=UPI00141FD3B4|nr:type II secretion system protein [Thalassoroseus pseudoceratinae]